MRVFLDTNVLVSAFASRGLCAELLELVLQEHDLIVGRTVLIEFEKAMRQKIKLPSARTSEIIDFVSTEAVLVVEGAEAARVKTEAADARVIGEALAGLADAFVTGDAELQQLATVSSMPIVSPRQFWDLLRAT